MISRGLGYLVAIALLCLAGSMLEAGLRPGSVSVPGSALAQNACPNGTCR